MHAFSRSGSHGLTVHDQLPFSNDTKTPCHLLRQILSLSPTSTEVYPTTDLILDRSDEADPLTVQSVSTSLSHYLSSHISDLETVFLSDGTVVNKPLAPRIEKMFQFVTKEAFFQIPELLFAAYLIQRLIENDENSHRTHHTERVNNDTIGTVLITSLVISNKMNRDIPIRNSWWVQAFGIPLKVLNESEEYFLVQLDYNIAPLRVHGFRAPTQQ